MSRNKPKKPPPIRDGDGQALLNERIEQLHTNGIIRLPAPKPDERLSQITMAPRSPRAPIQRTNLARIEQRFVGELSGSISGSVYCYGYALHKDMCIVLNMGGPHMAVEVIRACHNELVAIVSKSQIGRDDGPQQLTLF